MCLSLPDRKEKVHEFITFPSSDIYYLKFTTTKIRKNLLKSELINQKYVTYTVVIFEDSA